MGIRMSTLAIIENFDVVKHSSPRFRPCLIGLSMNPLPFEQGKETFRYRIIVTISRPTHTAFYPLVPQKFLEIMAGILTPPIRMMNKTRGWVSTT